MSESKPVVLRSSSNPTIRHLVRMRDNRARRKAQRVIVDGWRETSLALSAGLTLCGLYTTQSELSVATGEIDSRDSVLRRPDACSAITLVSESLMQRIGYGQSPRGLVAEFERPNASLGDIRLPDNPFVFILDQIEKPGNVGAVFRCADSAGVDAVLLCKSHDPFSPNAIRNSLGTVFHVPTAAATPVELSKFLIENKISLMAARPESSEILWDADLRGPLAVVVGNEANGLGERWKNLEEKRVPGIRIPMAGSIDSLNASVTAAVIAFEVRRQRTTAPRG